MFSAPGPKSESLFDDASRNTSARICRHEFVGSGSVMDHTGHRLKRVTRSVMPPVSQCRKSSWRRGDMMIRGGNRILTVQGYLGLLG